MYCLYHFMRGLSGTCLKIPIFFKKEGPAFTIYSIYAVLVYSVTAWIITDILPVDVTIASPLAETDLFLCAVFGGIISGCGSGLTVRFGGAIDGIDVLGVMFAKRLGLSLGSFVMIYNVVAFNDVADIFPANLEPDRQGK